MGLAISRSIVVEAHGGRISAENGITGGAKPAGYSVDLCTRVAAAVGKELALPNLQMKWVKGSVADRIEAVAKGTIDLECGSTTASLSRQEHVDFSRLTFIDGGSLLVTDASQIRGVASLGGKRVAIIPGTTTEKSLAEALKKHGVSTTVVPVKDHDAGVAALDGGTADAYASDRVILMVWAALVAATIVVPGRGVHAQTLEPRSYTNTPVGMNFLLLGYGYTEGDVGFDASSPVKDAKVHIHAGLLAYARSLDVWGLSGKVLGVRPFAEASGSAKVAGQGRDRQVFGLADPLLRFSVNFFGAPALSMGDFPTYRQDIIVGAGLQVTAPLGQYPPSPPSPRMTTS